jgi:hypothetical protein
MEMHQIRLASSVASNPRVKRRASACVSGGILRASTVRQPVYPVVHAHSVPGIDAVAKAPLWNNLNQIKV